jgi:hypothetical protein
MQIATERYKLQAGSWPPAGRHILAHFDEQSIVVYQAYRPSIARYAVKHGRFGGPDFSFSRMSWIKPNFLWMMYRAGWGMKPGQECILGLRISRAFFESLLEAAVPSAHDAALHSTREAWQAAVQTSEVRLQWDPDHSPSGRSLERKALQLGLRGASLRAFATSELLGVIDFTPFVASQRPHVEAGSCPTLDTPLERVYVPNSKAARRIGIDATG